MKKTLLLVILNVSIGFLLKAQAPSFQWAKSFESAVSSEVYGNSVTVDGSKNVISTGLFSGTVDFDPNAGIFNLSALVDPVGSYGTYVSKLDSLGGLIWAVSIGDTTGYFFNSQILTADVIGNIYITGAYSGTVDFDPGFSVYNMTSSGVYIGDTYVLKLDPAGNFLWVKSVGTPLQSTQPTSIAVDGSGNVYVSGGFKDTVDFDPGVATYTLMTGPTDSDAFILKLDASGNFVWAKNIGGIGGTIADINGISLDGLGDLLCTGRLYGTIDFDPSSSVYSLTSSGGVGNADMYVLKLDSGGNFVWVKQLETSIVLGYSSAIYADSVGNIYTTGWFAGTVDLDPGPGISSCTSSGASANPNAFVLKLDSSGNYVWGKSFIHSLAVQGTSITADNSGNVFTTGIFNGTVDFDPGVGNFYLTSGDTSAYGYHAFISKLDSAGNFVWAGALSGDWNSGGWGASITLDESQDIYLTGMYAGTVDVNPNGGIDSMSAFNVINAIILKLSRTAAVWPGDADLNNIADNNDLLPIGIFYGQTATSRASLSNTWQAFSSTDWGVLQTNGADIKHVDCNGDGIIDNNDTLAINLNFSLTHAFALINNELRLSAPDLYFVTSSSLYSSGSIVDVEVWLGNSTTPISNLYGIAFDINYDASLVQSATENLTYPTSWLGTSGTDAITIAKIDAVGNTAYGAETKINQINSNGFGKIADFKFQLKSSIPANTQMIFSMSSYSANDSNGNTVLFNTQPDTILINSTAGVTEIGSSAQFSIYPNPSNGSFNIFTCEQIKPARPAGGNGSIEIYNSIGELILSQKIINQENTIDLKNQASGLYFVKVISDGEMIGMKKIVKE